MTPIAIDAPRPLKSEMGRAAARFRANRLAVLGVLMLAFVAAYIVIGSFAFTETYANDTDLRARWQAPSTAHPFGTDSVGRDVLARTIYGGQISLAVGLLSVLVIALVGVPLGLMAGYFGGWVDSLIMRSAEAMLSIPLLFFLLVLSRVVGQRLPDFSILGRQFSGSVIALILVIGFTGWMRLARIVRANTLSIKQREYVLAARALGASSGRILLRHILPNTVAPVIVFVTLGVSGAILLESYVSFLGFGVQAPTASWGNMLQRAVEKIDTAYWLWLFPGALTLLTVLSVNFIGDGLRDALDTASAGSRSKS